jgi:hypothetical protein
MNLTKYLRPSKNVVDNSVFPFFSFPQYIRKAGKLLGGRGGQWTDTKSYLFAIINFIELEPVSLHTTTLITCSFYHDEFFASNSNGTAVSAMQGRWEDGISQNGSGLRFFFRRIANMPLFYSRDRQKYFCVRRLNCCLNRRRVQPQQDR